MARNPRRRRRFVSTSHRTASAGATSASNHRDSVQHSSPGSRYWTAASRVVAPFRPQDDDARVRRRPLDRGLRQTEHFAGPTDEYLPKPQEAPPPGPAASRGDSIPRHAGFHAGSAANRPSGRVLDRPAWEPRSAKAPPRRVLPRTSCALRNRPPTGGYDTVRSVHARDRSTCLLLASFLARRPSS